MKARRPRKKPSTWQASAQWKQIARTAIRTWNAKRSRLPKCGARRRRDDEPCENLAMANGRCHRHGGLSQKGDAWGKPRWPDPGSPVAMKKLNRKLNDLQRAAAKRAKRVARMTPDELAKYRAWQKSHQPGSAAARARARRERKDAQEMRELFLKVERDAEIAAAIRDGKGVFA